MTPVLLCLAFVAADPQRVLVMDLEAVSVAASDADAATRVVAAAAAQVDGLTVLSSADLRRIASLESERVNAGCDENASCMAELAGALDAGRVVYGSLSRLGTTTTVVLALYDARTNAVTRRSFDVNDTGALPPLLRAGTAELLTGKAGSPSTSSPSTAEPDAGGPVLGLATIGGGAGIAALGGATALVAEYVFVQDKNGDGAQKPMWQAIGVGGVVVAGAGLAVAVVGGALMAGGM